MVNMKTNKIVVFIIMCCGINHFTFSQEKAEEILTKKVEKEILELMDEGNIPGLVLVTIKNGHQTINNFGYSNLDDKKPVTSKTLFELGSCSKAFTALAIGNLEHQKKIELDASVSAYLPWFRVSYKGNEETITVRQLLHHTSGIPWNTISKIPQSAADDALEQTVMQLVGQELHNLPGKEHEYATINYDVLALVVEKITDQTFEEYVQENMFNKLQLCSTTIGRPSDTTLMATGYKIGFFQPRVYKAPIYRGNNAAGYVISNAKDISRWLKFQMGLIDSDLYALAKWTHQRDESVPLHDMSAYAKGWEVSLNGTGEIYHSGLNPNFTSYITFRPEEKIGVAVLANSNSNHTMVIGNKIMKLLANEKIEREFDPGDGRDKSYSSVSIGLGLYMVVVISFIITTVVSIAKGRRKYETLNLKKLSKFARSLIMILPFLYGFYILPEAIAGFSWESMFVWSPLSFAVLVAVILGALVISYLAFFISLCFPEENKYKRKVPVILLMSILSGLSNVIVVVMVTSAIDTDIELKYLIFYYALTLAIYLLGRKFVQVNLIRVTRGLVYDLRINLIEKIFSTSYQKFEKIDRGRVYTALNDDVNTIGQSTNLLVALITSVITATGAFLYLASVAFWATLLTICLIVSLSTIYYFTSRSTNIYFEEARDVQNDFMRLISGMIDGFKEISLHRNKKIKYKEDMVISANEYREKISTADIRFVNAFLIGESLLVVLLGIVSFGMPEMFPNIKPYTIMSFVVILLYLIGPINGILGSAPAIMRLKVAWKRLQEFMKEFPANLDLEEAPKPIDAKVESIKAIGIKFKYKEKSNQDVFEVGPIDFEARTGEIIFIVGGNGSGKTTLAKLLAGLYEPHEGQLMINEKVLKGSQLGEYFSVIFSPLYLFKKLYNIDSKGKSKEVEKYLQLLDLKEKVKIIENEYNSIDLSGGQRKRLALLQCYLEDSPIYLFDEWAADQDPGYRKFFYRTLLPEMKKLGKIVIAITHDDHYFDIADKILKMNQGKLESYFGEYLLQGTANSIVTCPYKES
jgi:cyclic peptide transporter